jgi:hypothetical protein
VALDGTGAEKLLHLRHTGGEILGAAGHPEAGAGVEGDGVGDGLRRAVLQKRLEDREVRCGIAALEFVELTGLESGRGEVERRERTAETSRSSAEVLRGGRPLVESAVGAGTRP